LRNNIFSIKSSLSKLKFNLGFNPEIQKLNDFRKYIPGSYKAVILIYADFELAWAWRYSKDLISKKEEVLNIAQKERENIPGILKLCEQYNIPITWATLGHLFLEKCEKKNGIAHPEIKRIDFFENDYWIFNKGDWFDDDPCSNYENSPEWYCPDLIKNITGSNVKHEIGCHTFSHIDCRDEVCSTEVFESEINICKELAGKYKIELKSFVHPGHTIGNLDNLARLGFSSYRTDNGNILGYPVKHSNGLWEIKGTMELAYRKKWNVEFNIEFYKKIVDRAIKNNSVCTFWFHPSFDKLFLADIYPELLNYINEKRSDVFLTTAGEYVNLLNNN
jgi:peptidoglycan/xylan/chitin deacetylase (PgdA/CDA1 family)